MKPIKRLLLAVVAASALAGPACALAQERPSDGPRVFPKPAERTEVRREEMRARDAAVFEADRKARAVAQEANLAPLIKQYTPVFRNTLRAEYYFARTVCALAPEQRKQIAREAEAGLEAVVRKYAEAQFQMRQGRWRADMSAPEPQAMVRENLTKVLEAHASREQLARYQEEVRKRADDRKHASADCFVARLDTELVLTADQRDKIAHSLRENWDDGWGRSLESVALNDQMIPDVPAWLVVPHLSANQKSVWSAMPRVRFTTWFNAGVVGAVDTSPLEDEATGASGAGDQ